jgi:hypothetical protein
MHKKEDKRNSNRRDSSPAERVPTEAVHVVKLSMTEAYTFVKK